MAEYSITVSGTAFLELEPGDNPSDFNRLDDALFEARIDPGQHDVLVEFIRFLED